MFLDFSKDNIDILTTRKSRKGEFPEKYELWDFFIQIPSNDLLKHRGQFT